MGRVGERRNRKLGKILAGIIANLASVPSYALFGKDIQDEKSLLVVATGSDHLGGSLAPELFNSKKMPPMTISFTLPKTPEIIVSQVRMYKNDEVFPILENFEPTSFLLQSWNPNTPCEKFASGVS